MSMSASRQRIREIRKELSALNSERDELEKSLQNRRAELEHLMEGSFIAAKAKPLGLRPPDPRQRVIQLRLVATDKGLEARPRIVGYNRRELAASTHFPEAGARDPSEGMGLVSPS